MSSLEKKAAALSRFEQMRQQPTIGTVEFHSILAQLLDATTFTTKSIGHADGREFFDSQPDDDELSDALDEMDALLHSLEADNDGNVSTKDFGGYHWDLARQGKISTISHSEAGYVPVNEDYGTRAAWQAIEAEVMRCRSESA